jgi:predicted DNA-binding transcriptional regulator AlpA
VLNGANKALVPGLDEILRDPARAVGLPRETRAGLMAQCAAVMGTLAAVSLGSDSSARDDRLLTVEEAARVLAVSTDWTYRHGKRLGLTVKLGDGTLRFSSAAIQQAIAENKISPLPGRRRKNRPQPESDHLTN